MHYKHAEYNEKKPKTAPTGNPETVGLDAAVQAERLPLPEAHGE